MVVTTNNQTFSLFAPKHKIHIIYFLGFNVSIYSNLIGQSDN